MFLKKGTLMNIVNIAVPQVQTFDFTVPGVDGVHHIPLMEYLPKRLVRAYLDLQSIDDEQARGTAADDWMSSVFALYCPELDLDDRPLSFTQAIMSAWGDASNDDLGESQGSSVSATSTGAPSTTTSSPAPDTPSMISPTV